MRKLIAVLAVLVLGVAPARALEIRPITSPGGLTAWVSPDPAATEIAIIATWRGGSLADPKGRAGTSQVATAAMAEGAGDRDAVAFKTAVQDLGVRMGVNAGPETANAILSTPKDNIAAAADLFRDLLNAPRFEAGDIARVRKGLRVRLADLFKQPGTMASIALNEVMIPDHPSTTNRLHPGEDLPDLTREALEAWRRDHLARDNLILSVAGAITPEAAGPLLDGIFGALPAKSAVPPAPAHVYKGAGQILTVAREGDQSLIVVTAPFMPEDWTNTKPAHAIDDVLIDIVGEGSVGRLHKKIREEKGLSYGVGMSERGTELGTTYVVSTSVPNDKAAEVLGLIRGVLDQVAREGVTEEEVAAAKERLTGRFGRDITSPLAAASVMTGLALKRRPATLYAQVPDLFRAVTRDQVNEAARTYLPVAKSTAVVVGQPVGLTGPGGIGARAVEIR